MLAPVLPPTILDPARENLELPLTLVSSVLTLGGIYLAYRLFGRPGARLATAPPETGLARFLKNGWELRPAV